MIAGKLTVIGAVEFPVFVKGELTTAAKELHLYSEHVGVGIHRLKSCSFVEFSAAYAEGVIRVDHLYLKEDAVSLVVLKELLEHLSACALAAALFAHCELVDEYLIYAVYRGAQTYKAVFILEVPQIALARLSHRQYDGEGLALAPRERLAI